MSVDKLTEECHAAYGDGVRAAILFGIPKQKDSMGRIIETNTPDAGKIETIYDNKNRMSKIIKHGKTGTEKICHYKNYH